MRSIFDLAMEEAEDVMRVDPESIIAGANMLDELRLGTFYSHCRANDFLDGVHPYGPEHVYGTARDGRKVVR